MGKRNTMGGQDIFKYLGYIILYDGNTIVRKYGHDMKATLNHTYRLTSNFLPGLIIFNLPRNLG